MTDSNLKACATLPRMQDALKLIESSQLTNADRYLDIGCSDGKVTMEVAGCVNASEVYGADVDEGLLTRSKQSGIKTLSIDLNRDSLPFADDFFDLITSFEVIEHLVNPDNMLKEAKRTLKPNGCLS